MTVRIDIPDSVVNAFQLPPKEVELEVTRELALALYTRGVLSLGAAAEFAGMERAEFERLMGARKIVRNYSEDDLKHDLQWAGEQE